MRHYLLGTHIVLQDLVVRNYMGLTLSYPDHSVLLQYSEFSKFPCSIWNCLEQSSLHEMSLYSYSS